MHPKGYPGQTGIIPPDDLDAAQSQQGELAGSEYAEGRTPEPAAPTGVQLCALTVPAQPVHHGLVESDEEVERPDLPAVGVPRELQIDTRRDRVRDELWLVREEQHGQRRVCP